MAVSVCGYGLLCVNNPEVAHICVTLHDIFWGSAQGFQHDLCIMDAIYCTRILGLFVTLSCIVFIVDLRNYNIGVGIPLAQCCSLVPSQIDLNITTAPFNLM